MRKIVATLSETNDVLTRCLGLVMAFVFTSMLLAQLYTFDRFPEVLASTLSLQVELASVLCGVIVLTELLALPFLLNIPLTKLMRLVSAACGFIVLGFWTYVVICTLGTSDIMHNTAIAGDTALIPSGGWLLFFLAGLATIAAWYTLRMTRLK